MSDGNLEPMCLQCGEEVEHVVAHAVDGLRFHPDCCPACVPLQRPRVESA